MPCFFARSTLRSALAVACFATLSASLLAQDNAVERARALWERKERSALLEARGLATQACATDEATSSAAPPTLRALSAQLRSRLLLAAIENSTGDAASAAADAEKALAAIAAAPKALARDPMLVALHIEALLRAARAHHDLDQRERVRPYLDHASEIFSDREADVALHEESKALRRELGRLDVWWHLAAGANGEVSNALRRFRAACQDSTWHSLEIELELQVALIQQSPLEERKALLPEAELIARSALAALDAASSNKPADRELHFRFHLAQLALAELRTAGGEPSAARAILDAALDAALQLYAELHVDAISELRLLAALRLRCTLTPLDQRPTRQRAAAAACFPFVFPEHAASGAEFLLAAGAPEEAMTCLMERAQRLPPMRKADFLRACFDPLRTDPRFAQLFATGQ